MLGVFRVFYLIIWPVGHQYYSIMIRNNVNQPIVQGKGHIIGTRNSETVTSAKCAIYEDTDGNIYATADLIALEEWLRMYGCDGYIDNN